LERIPTPIGRLETFRLSVPALRTLLSLRWNLSEN